MTKRPVSGQTYVRKAKTDTGYVDHVLRMFEAGVGFLILSHHHYGNNESAGSVISNTLFLVKLGVYSAEYHPKSMRIIVSEDSDDEKDPSYVWHDRHVVVVEVSDIPPLFPTLVNLCQYEKLCNSLELWLNDYISTKPSPTAAYRTLE
jgi:hypothetical protein